MVNKKNDTQYHVGWKRGPLQSHFVLFARLFAGSFVRLLDVFQHVERVQSCSLLRKVIFEQLNVLNSFKSYKYTDRPHNSYDL